MIMIIILCQMQLVVVQTICYTYGFKTILLATDREYTCVHDDPPYILCWNDKKNYIFEDAKKKKKKATY